MPLEGKIGEIETVWIAHLLEAESEHEWTHAAIVLKGGKVSEGRVDADLGLCGGSNCFHCEDFHEFEDEDNSDEDDQNDRDYPSEFVVNFGFPCNSPKLHIGIQVAALDNAGHISDTNYLLFRRL